MQRKRSGDGDQKDVEKDLCDGQQFFVVSQ